MSQPLVAIYKLSNAWYSVPTPSDYKGSSSTLVNSGRNTKGEVIGDVIKSDVAKIELTWNYMTVADFSALAQIFEPAYNSNNTNAFMRPVAFFDVIKGDFDGSNASAPNASTNNCRIMYPNDRAVKFAKIKLDSNGKPIGYEGVSLHLIDTGKRFGDL